MTGDEGWNKATLEPGRELDREVAEKVFGYYVHQCMSSITEASSPTAAFSVALRPYSTDPTINREVREWLIKRLGGLNIWFDGNEWVVTRYQIECGGVIGITLEHAICLAALHIVAEGLDE